jgi:hypothetical protein
MQQKIKNLKFPYRISIDIISNPGQCLRSIPTRSLIDYGLFLPLFPDLT